MIKVLLLLAALSFTEAEHAKKIVEDPKGSAFHGVLEFRLWDKTRVDILTLEYAYEVDWAPKWAEGIGQALYYGIVTGKKPGLILLTKKGEERYVYRAQTVCAKHGIKLVVRRVEEEYKRKPLNLGYWK